MFDFAPGHIVRAGEGFAVVTQLAADQTLLVCPLHDAASAPTGALTLPEGALESTGEGAPLPGAGTFRCDVLAVHRVRPEEAEASGWRLTGGSLEQLLRQRVLGAVCGHHAAAHAPRSMAAQPKSAPVSGKCWGPEEVSALVDASLDFWLTAGRYHDRFEESFAQRLGRRFALAVNSGSSANLLAVATLCSPALGARRLVPGDEVITVAAGFPTTVAPLVQHGLIPVFVDACPPTYNIVPEDIEAALTPRTRAIMLAHTLGNPFDLQRVLEVANARDLWVIEDSCDALGSLYTLPGEAPRPSGSFGHVSTFSFYPAHHITMGEGGAVACDAPELKRIALSLRDWGRDCWCPTGHDNTCKRRYQRKFPLLPEGYDHKYVYSHLGYNLKITDMQAAIGVTQLERLEGFGAARRRNFTRLSAALAPLDGEQLILPKATPNSDPSWFGFPITLSPRFERRALLEHLNGLRIGTRLLFAGNILCQPCFEGVAHRRVGELSGTDAIMHRSFWVGTYPALGDAHVDHIAEGILEWFRSR